MNPTLTSSTDTIAAPASPAGAGAVALLRVSGPDAARIAGEVFRGPALQPRRATFGSLTGEDGSVIDQVLVTFFKGPASFTGEDTAEIACHGGTLVTRRVLERLLQAGARAAEPGEFTRRAFLNSKVDLTQAEAVMDLITAQTDLALRAANRQLAGALGAAIHLLLADLLGLLAHVEAHIDFPEEDIDPDTGAALLAKVDALVSRVDALLATAGQGKILREGLRTVIAGRPNAGKSSLLNRLLGFERAIVSETPGTTRDTIEEVISLRGFPVRLVDTAGLRGDTEDGVEREGISRTGRELRAADLILEVVDASCPDAGRLDPAEEGGAARVLVLNKSDRPHHADWLAAGGVPISCTDGSGMEALADAIIAVITRGGGGLQGAEVAVNARHQACLERARAALLGARAEFVSGSSPEFTALDLRLALEALGEVVGRVDVEDLLGVVFSQFCIGK